ncbi:MAG: hypothetical protein OEQ28_00275 [Acidobacteriota bacterium]|nr:hypothetical protein [Acidobacteriota bacterium]
MAIGAMGGAPLSAAETMNGNRVCPMKCCKKAAKAKETAGPHRNNFCRLTSCTETMPSAPSSSNVVQASFIVSTVAEHGFSRIANSTRPKDIRDGNYLSDLIPSGAPLFLTHNSLLI